MKKLDRWGKDVERGFHYVFDMFEEEQQKTETIEETKARHRTMENTALLCLELINQCPRCGHWDAEKIGCKIREECIVNCPDVDLKAEDKEE